MVWVRVRVTFAVLTFAVLTFAVESAVVTFAVVTSAVVYVCHYYILSGIFSRPTRFLQKSSCRVSSEKNILNSSVEWSHVDSCGVESCGVEKLDKSYVFVYFLKHFLFIINTVIRGAHDN